MKTRQFILLLSTTAILGACVATAPPQPYVDESYSPYYATGYLSADGLDMGTPVYVAAYPDYVFYHRYDPACDCIRIVRMLDIGGTRYWVDHTGRRVHDGHWEPARPSAHALRGYREWSHQHQTEFHRAPRSPEAHRPMPAQIHPASAPAAPHVQPHPQPLIAPAPQPLIANVPPGQPDKPAKKGKTQTLKPTPKPQGPEQSRPGQDTKRRPDVKPAQKPAPKAADKPAKAAERHSSDKPEGAQK